MPIFAPDFIARAASGHWTRTPGRALTGFGVDSRTLREGQVFVALRTPVRDGHAFLPAAAQAGAGAAIVSTPDQSIDLPQLVVPDPLLAFQAIARAWRQAFDRPVVAVTGSAGKTSTKELLARLLSVATGDVLATEGNLNNHLGVPLTLLRLEPGRHRYAVIEAGIGGPGEMAPLVSMIEPDLAIVTLIAPAHIEALGSIEGVAREKAILPAGARSGALKLFPAACLVHAPFRELPAPCHALACEVAQGGEGTTVRFVVPGSRELETYAFRRVSDGMASNAALALAAARSLGVTEAEARARLSGWSPAALRGEIRRDERGRLLYVDCYNANPASMKDALAAFAAVAPVAAPRLYILGGMEELGSESLVHHRTLGREVAALLREGDRALVAAAPEAAAAVVEGAAHPAVCALADLGALRTRFETFAGSVFLKGSRRYRLEALLSPLGAAEAAAH